MRRRVRWELWVVLALVGSAIAAVVGGMTGLWVVALVALGAVTAVGWFALEWPRRSDDDVRR